MKKFLLLIGATIFSAGFAMAQHSNHDGHNHGSVDAVGASVPVTDAKPQVMPKGVSTITTPPASTTSLTVENLSFEQESHDFGTLPEGPAADYEFKFKNTGKEPIILQTVNASCGCTTPSWSKEPVLPGKTGSIKASYNTQGRPGGFTKSITVVSNAGTKVLSIKGSVEAAPTGSAPTSTKSMIQNK